ncbi:ferredoxin [Nocardia huaxiensis]|uniref:Ferredoxin n=1 Tax=Nocardia huaxiensis TaxID=2755382 RepID=A0A7D6VE70_9NOCA|nr:ferredoxin [Nocardia huaxiensis]QLY30375.1 ferredoxin family protein [Nocardia huaxiensis]UFS95988.1 ferredoxin family protein [Nocardia huaxiensis]
MTFVVAASCVDVLDRACIEECPVDCIYIGERMAYIQPDECTDCGACEPACPVEAIYYEDDMPDGQEVFVKENARFFAETLPGRDAPFGSPGGGGARMGALGVDTPFVAAYQP